MPDSQQEHLLERLRLAAGEPLTFDQLREEGIGFPAATVSELELRGYQIDRVYARGRLVGVRLVEGEPRNRAAQTTRRWFRRSRR